MEVHCPHMKGFCDTKINTLFINDNNQSTVMCNGSEWYRMCSKYCILALWSFYILLVASHSPKNRRKKLNSRMKSFSLDTPEPSKHLLAIDETTKKKSSSFTNTCFGGDFMLTSANSLLMFYPPSLICFQPFLLINHLA